MKVSVCMATYNGQKYLYKQLSSILEQLSKNDEIIISDDGSSDNTLDIIKNFNDSRIKVLNHYNKSKIDNTKENKIYSVSKNFENALIQATGEIIILSDQDDIWIKGRVSAVKNALRIKDLMLCNYQLIDKQDNLIEDKHYQKNPLANSYFKNIFHSPFLGCCMAFKRESLKYCLPFPKKLIGHDLWIGNLIYFLGSYAYILAPLHQYRRHENNVTPVTGNSKNTFLFKVKYRIIVTIQLFFRIIIFEIRQKAMQCNSKHKEC